MIVAFADAERDLWGVAEGEHSPRLALGTLGGDLALEDRPVWISPLGSAGDGLQLVSVTLDDADAPPALGLGYTPELGRGLDSVRVTGAWFGGDRGIALSAVRERGVKGHDRDEIAIALIGESEHLQVFDPRLSTTYDAGGTPLRMGLEVWLGETEEGDQFPRRVAGEVTGGHAAGQADGVSWSAHALRCHSRGEDGAGVYLVLRPA